MSTNGLGMCACACVCIRGREGEIDKADGLKCRQLVNQGKEYYENSS